MERRKYEMLEEFGQSVIEVTEKYKEMLEGDEISIKGILGIKDENDRRLLMAVLISKGVAIEPLGYVVSATMEAVTGKDFATQFDMAMYLCNEASTEKMEQLFETVFLMAKTIVDVVEAPVEGSEEDGGSEANN